MSASKLPPEVARVIGAREVEWSEHAAEGPGRLDPDWLDAIELAGSGRDWRREADEHGRGPLEGLRR